MSRRIVTEKTQLLLKPELRGLDVAPAAPTPDSYLDRLVKYIPADINAAWVFVTSLISIAPNIPTGTILWIAFIVGVILTPIWVLRQTAEPNKPLAFTQAGISTGAFIVWVFALGEPFNLLSIYRPVYGSLLLILYTLVVAIIKPPEG